MNEYYTKLWAAEKWTLFICALGVVAILEPEMSDSFEDEFNLAVIFHDFISSTMMLGITWMPYFVFFLISRHIGNKKTSLPFSVARLIAAIFITLVSWWLYYSSGQAIDGNESSTASLIFVVLPFYILIGGAVVYGIIIAVDA